MLLVRDRIHLKPQLQPTLPIHSSSEHPSKKPQVMPESNEKGENKSKKPDYSRFQDPATIDGRLMLDSFLPKVSEDSEDTIFQRPAAGLGDFDVFPLELLHHIIPELDMETVEYFRRVNRLAREAVSSSLEYSFIKKHMPQLLQGIRFLGTGQTYSLKTLFDKLHTKHCEHCETYRTKMDSSTLYIEKNKTEQPNFGGYMYLLSARRLCLGCITYHVNCRASSTRMALFDHGLEEKDIQEANPPSIKFVPHLSIDIMTFQRTEGEEGFELERIETSLYDYSALLQAALQKYGGSDAIKHLEHWKPWSESMEKDPWVYDVAWEDALQYEPTSQSPIPNHSLMVVRTPWFDRRGSAQGMLKRGFACAYCANYAWHPDDQLQEYLEEDFEAHMGVCKSLQS
jgi:hypothetical protein